MAAIAADVIRSPVPLSLAKDRAGRCFLRCGGYAIGTAHRVGCHGIFGVVEVSAVMKVSFEGVWDGEAGFVAGLLVEWV